MPIAEQQPGKMASLLCRPESELSGGLVWVAGSSEQKVM